MNFGTSTSPLLDPHRQPQYNTVVHDLRPRASRVSGNNRNRLSPWNSDLISTQSSSTRFASSLSSNTTSSSSAILDTQIERPSNLVVALTFVTSISGFLFGYDTGYVSSVLVSLGTDLDGRQLTIKQQEWITSGASIGAFFASFLAGPLADYFGRRATVIICDLLFATGGLIQFETSHLTYMIAGRVIMGFGIGFGSLIAPLYISELSPGKYRGRLVTINCLAITAGQLAAYGMGAVLEHINSTWRYTILFSLLPCLIQLVTIVSLPDTPRFLIQTCRFGEAEEVLKRIYPRSSSDLIDASIEEMSAINAEEPLATGFIQNLYLTLKSLLLSSSSNRRALYIACGLQATQQFVGFNAVMYFAATIFKMLGFTNSASVSCLIAATNFIFTGLAFLIIDKVGRRRILLFSMPFVFIFQVLCAVAFLHIPIRTEMIFDNTSLKWTFIVVFSLIGFVASYASGLGVVPWQQSEMFPQSVRGLGSAFATATNWLGSTVVSASFLTIMDTFTPTGAFLLYASVTAFSYIAVYFTYPELGHLQLEEIGLLLKDGFNVSKSMQIQRQRHTALE